MYNASRDSYDKHKCFAGIKTGGQRPPSRGKKARWRIAEKKEKEPKEKTVGKEMEQTGVPFREKNQEESRVDGNKFLRCP